MIIRQKQHWFKTLLVWHGSVLPKLLPQLLLLLVWGIIVVLVKDFIFHYSLHLNPAPFTLFGIALALFLGFRNSASYDRFWEGRKLWGGLLNTSRSLALQALTLIDPVEENASLISPDPANTQGRTLFINYSIALAYALKHQLRKTDPTPDLVRLLPPEVATRIGQARFRPAMLIKEMGSWIQAARLQGRIDSIRQVAFDDNLSLAFDMIGGCERIASTPLPYSYSVLIHRTVYIYCFLLPLGLLDSLGWTMPFIVVFIAYTYVALEAIADELEEPFGTSPNDLPLDAMCRNLENAVLEMADRPILPDPPPPENYLLT
jgi:putative membrane protein